VEKIEFIPDTEHRGYFFIRLVSFSFPHSPRWSRNFYVNLGLTFGAGLRGKASATRRRARRDLRLAVTAARATERSSRSSRAPTSFRT